MTLNEFNHLPKEEAASQLATCCGSSKWQGELMRSFPFTDEQTLQGKAVSNWYDICSEADWLEAFTHHPKIGDVKSLTEKFASTQHLAGNEQAGVNEASVAVIQELALANAEYEKKFGFIFIVCATGKSAPDMLHLLKDRLKNTRPEELNIAMGEQAKISFLRLKRMIEGDWTKINGSRLTTHVLDTTLGKPGKNITIRLKRKNNETWESFAQGVTNSDGRVGDLLPAGKDLEPGNYMVVFETGPYFEAHKIKGFYPEVEIQFTVFDDAHYHVPLLINPFGYSTYRGS